jgi:hypothetical protein
MYITKSFYYSDREILAECLENEYICIENIYVSGIQEDNGLLELWFSDGVTSEKIFEVNFANAVNLNTEIEAKGWLGAWLEVIVSGVKTKGFIGINIDKKYVKLKGVENERFL